MLIPVLTVAGASKFRAKDTVFVALAGWVNITPILAEDVAKTCLDNSSPTSTEVEEETDSHLTPLVSNPAKGVSCKPFWTICAPIIPTTIIIPNTM